MKILLEHDEFLWLQRINKRPLQYNFAEPVNPSTPEYHINGKGRRTRHDNRIILRLEDAGLVKLNQGIFCPIEITPLGRSVLKEHLPWRDPINQAGAVWGSYGKEKAVLRIGSAAY